MLAPLAECPNEVANANVETQGGQPEEEASEPDSNPPDKGRQTPEVVGEKLKI